MHGIVSALLLVGAFAAVAVLAALLAMRLLRTTRGVSPLRGAARCLARCRTCRSPTRTWRR